MWHINTIANTLEKCNLRGGKFKKCILNSLNHLRGVIFVFVKHLSSIKNKIFIQIGILECSNKSSKQGSTA